MTFTKSGNQSPGVYAGPDQTITLADNALLDGMAADDGLPNPPGALTTTWSLTAGPGSVIFADASAIDTTANFSIAGDYILRLTVDDGELNVFDEVTITVNPVNNAPIAADDSYSTDEDNPLFIAAPGVLGNDSDADNDPITAIFDTQPNNGTLLPNPDGSFNYTPSPNFNGTDFFTYLANDGLENSNLATVTITVNPVNDAPAADANGPYTGTVGLSLQFDGSSSNDEDGTIVSYDWEFGDGSSGSGPNPTHIYAAVGVFNVVLTVTDDGGASAIDTTTAVILAEPNAPPVAADDAYSIDEDHSLIISAPGVLENDSDADNDPLTAIVDTQPNNGTLTFNPDGSFNYMPSPNFNGTDSFTYLAKDGLENSNVATVTITVNPVNDVPAADANGPYTGTVGISLQFDGSGSGDIDGTITSYDWEFGDGSSGSGPNPTHIYTAVGVFNVVLTVTDDGGATAIDTTTAVILAEPNAPPVAADDAYSIDEDQSLVISAPGVLENDSDADNDPLTAIVDTQPNNGALTFYPDGSFNYTPSPNFNGTDSFTYLANDGQENSNLATVTITVNPVNDAPAADANGPYTGTVGISLQFNGSGSSDMDGTITSYDWEFGDGSSGSGPNPTHIYTNVGVFSVVLTVTDDGEATAIDTTTAVILAAPNNAPVAVDDSYSTDEDHSLIIAAPGVLGNDSDVDNDSLTAVTDTGPNNGTLTFNPDGSFNYAPSPNFNGTDSFTYLANDGQENSNLATVTITVNPLNDSPVAVDDSDSVTQGGTLNKAAPGLLSNDNDPENDPLTVTTTPVTLPGNGALTLNADGSYSYIHDGSLTTSDSFVYQVCDTGPLCDTAEVNISIAPSTPTIFEVRVAAKSDDAEERASGRVRLTSSDLDLVFDRELQTVGIRFNEVAIPRSAHISSAHIQFKADETHSEPTILKIHGEDVSNALTFVNVTNNITNRNLTEAYVDWNPPAWVNKGDAGPAQQTLDIAAVIQEIVSREDWAQGNSLVIIISSTDPNKRVAESYNGDQAGAPLLHVEYIYNNPPAANNNTAGTDMTFQ
jgi:VCBS repeat-containing protein